MRTYVAGPMRHRPMHNFPAFFKAAELLRNRGDMVVNPAERDMREGFKPGLPEEDQGFDLDEAFKWDFRMLIGCDAIYLLNGWETSRGAMAELEVAQLCGLDVQWEEGALNPNG